MAVNKNAAPAKPRVSFRLDNFSAGGVLPEGDYDIVGASFVLFTYTDKGGNAGPTTTALHLTLKSVVNGQPEGEDLEQHYSVGDPANFVPSEDGLGLEAAGTRTTLAKGSNFGIFMENLVNAGFPEDKFDNDCSVFVGTRGHIVHIPAPDRPGLKQSAVATGQVNQQQRKFEKTIPVFKTVIKLPWEKAGKAAPKQAAKPGTKPATAPAPVEQGGDGEVDTTRVAEYILNSVQGNGGTIGRTQCRLQVHREYNKAKIEASERDAEIAVFNDDAKLNGVLEMIGCVQDGSNIVLVK